MDKKQKKVTPKEEVKKMHQAQEEQKEETGFPEDIDFKRFLGCGG